MPTKQNLETNLDRARIAIENALSNPTIQTYLSEYGYSKEKLQAGQQLYQTALDLQQKQRREYGEQIEATAERDKLWDIAHATYMKFVKIARIAYKNNTGIATQLGINGNRKEVTEIRGLVDDPDDNLSRYRLVDSQQQINR
jgi:hypothetical protein